MTEGEKQAVTRALKPLADIYAAYLDNNLDDEARRFWGSEQEHENKVALDQIEMVQGRGGNRLLTLQQCKDAHDLIGKL